ncbi:MAG: Gfo/Idh/MocA family oxidoreductase [Bacteroidota bacterium]|nr:Gfo/Idh/MocA family oxidoreductase [Bacteroidota bacterium]
MLKIGVLGAGHLGRIHIGLLKDIEEYDLIGFYDKDRSKAAKVEHEFGITAFDSEEALMDKVEVMDIVTPTSLHYECALRALNAGRHFFVEKPLTNTVDEAEVLVKLLEQTSLKGMVGHVERFNPAFQAAQKVGLEPLFIEGHRLAEFKPRGIDVSVILDLMIHDIDLILSLIPYEVVKVNASGVAVVSDHVDIANARIEFENGAVANLTCSRISLKTERKLRLFQRNAYITIDLHKKELNIFKLKDLGHDQDTSSLFVLDLGEDKGRKEVIFESPALPDNNAIQTELKEFALCILRNTPPPVTLRDGLRSMRLAQLILEQITLNVNKIDSL